MDQPRNANARRDLSNASSALDMYIVKSEISFLEMDHKLALHWHEDGGKEGKGKDTLGLVITTNEIVHDIRVPDAFCNLFFVANVPFLPNKHGTSKRHEFYSNT